MQWMNAAAGSLQGEVKGRAQTMVPGETLALSGPGGTVTRRVSLLGDNTDHPLSVHYAPHLRLLLECDL